MEYQETLKKIDKLILQWKQEREIELKDPVRGEDWFGDVISDYILFNIEEIIAKYAISCNDNANIEGFSLSDILNKDLEYEDRCDVSKSDLLSKWIMVSSGHWKKTEDVKPEKPSESVLKLMKYYLKEISI